MSPIRRFARAVGRLVAGVGERLARWGESDGEPRAAPLVEGEPPELSEGPPAHWVEMIRAKAPWLLEGDRLVGDSIVMPRFPAAAPESNPNREPACRDESPVPAQPTRPMEPRRSATPIQRKAQSPLGTAVADVLRSPSRSQDEIPGGWSTAETPLRAATRRAVLSAPERRRETDEPQAGSTVPPDDQPQRGFAGPVDSVADGDAGNERPDADMAVGWSTFGAPRRRAISPLERAAAERRSTFRPPAPSRVTRSPVKANDNRSRDRPSEAGGGPSFSAVTWASGSSGASGGGPGSAGEPFPEDDDRWPELPDNRLDLWQTELIQYHHQLEAIKRRERLTAEQAGSSWSGPPF